MVKRYNLLDSIRNVVVEFYALYIFSFVIVKDLVPLFDLESFRLELLHPKSINCPIRSAQFLGS